MRHQQAAERLCEDEGHRLCRGIVDDREALQHAALSRPITANQTAFGACERTNSCRSARGIYFWGRRFTYKRCSA